MPTWTDDEGNCHCWRETDIGQHYLGQPGCFFATEKPRRKKEKKMPCKTDVCEKCGNYDCPGFNTGVTCIFPVKSQPNKEEASTEETAPAWMLCEAMTIVEKLLSELATEFAGSHIDFSLKSRCSQQLILWWNRHQTKEDSRVRREAASKLTDRERLALGIDSDGMHLEKSGIKKDVAISRKITETLMKRAKR